MTRGVVINKKVREIIISQHKKGNSVRKIAKNVELAPTSVFNIIKLYKESNNINVRGKSFGRPKLVTQRDQRKLRKICKSNRRGTVRELTVKWNENTGLNVSRECCRKYIHKIGLGFYKVH
jgi:transposase